jgi:cob(I)alamin adenosyltransferase
MRLYTRTGDGGETGLYGGGRVRKSAPLVHALGEVDEANAAIGVARSLDPGSGLDAQLEVIQHRLFNLGADLAGPQDPGRLTAAQVTELERAIDALETANSPLRAFILPGGGPQAAALHLARTVTRRAERALVALADAGGGPGAIGLAYVNRLSDYLFAAARWANRDHGDMPWKQEL